MLACFVFLLVFLLNFFSPKKRLRPFVLGVFFGFWLDFFSPLPFGLFAVFLLFLSLFISKTSALFEQSSIFSFLIIFFFAFCLYQLPFLLISFVWRGALFNFLFYLIIALIFFLIYGQKKN